MNIDELKKAIEKADVKALKDELGADCAVLSLRDMAVIDGALSETEDIMRARLDLPRTDLMYKLAVLVYPEVITVHAKITKILAQALDEPRKEMTFEEQEQMLKSLVPDESTVM